MCLDQAEIVTKFNFRPMAALYFALYDNGDTGKHIPYESFQHSSRDIGQETLVCVFGFPSSYIDAIVFFFQWSRTKAI